MNVKIISPDVHAEFFTPEDCWILEAWNNASDPAVSISRARVETGKTTKLHRLLGVTERYLIVKGTGIVCIGSLEPKAVGPGDIVIIPASEPQRIQNTGEIDLIFYCICSPRFTPECYEALE